MLHKVFLTFELKATKQYFPVYCAVQGGSTCTFESVDEILIQMKATEQYFPVVLFIMLYKVVLTFESVDETLKCGHSNESF